jgi:hypothetical protein
MAAPKQWKKTSKGREVTFIGKVVAADPSSPMVMADDARLPRGMIVGQPSKNKGARNLAAYYQAM